MFFAAWKINILEAKNGGRWKRMFRFNWVTFWAPACNFQGCILGLHNTFPFSWFHSMATWRFLSGQKSQTEQVHLPTVSRMKIIPVARRPSDQFEQVSHDKNLYCLKPLLNLHTLALPFKVLSSPAPKAKTRQESEDGPERILQSLFWPGIVNLVAFSVKKMDDEFPPAN